MGTFMREHDIYVEDLLGQLNVRFGPSSGKKSHYGGIAEMAALQKEFELFRVGRPFRKSVAVLNIGASNVEARNRLLDYFGHLAEYDSNIAGKDGDEAIVAQLLANFAAKKPRPVYFTYHDMRAAKGNTRVLVSEKGRPVSFFQQDYLTVSFPTREAGSGGKPAAKKSR
jgi:hypothetical protein